MKERMVMLAVAVVPAQAIAQAAQETSVGMKLFISMFPILLLIGAFWLFARSLNKRAGSINERLLESNKEIAKQLKRIADHVEKGS